MNFAFNTASQEEGEGNDDESNDNTDETDTNDNSDTTDNTDNNDNNDTTDDTDTNDDSATVIIDIAAGFEAIKNNPHYSEDHHSRTLYQVDQTFDLIQEKLIEMAARLNANA